MPRIVRVVRNVEFNRLFDSFFISAITTILLIRFYLSVTGYPQIGGSTLHISHLLPGTLMMLGATLLLLASVNRAARDFSAILAGVGFGFVWDELGKFITKDNNYFFKATPGLIYITFVVLYLIVRRVGQRRLRQDDYLANVLDLIKDGAVKDLDQREYLHAKELLGHVSSKHPLYAHTSAMLDVVKPHGNYQPTLAERSLNAVTKPLNVISRSKHFPELVVVVSIAYGLTCLASAAFFFAGAFRDTLQLDFSLLKGDESDVIGGISLAASAIFMGIGAVQYLTGRLRKAYRSFELALLINIFVGQVILFFKSQRLAIIGLAVTLFLLVNLQILIVEAKHRKVANRV
jgi:hypothetical protein